MCQSSLACDAKAGVEHHSSRSRKALQNTCTHAGGAGALKNMREPENCLASRPRRRQYLNAGVISIFVSGLLLYGFSAPAWCVALWLRQFPLCAKHAIQVRFVKKHARQSFFGSS